MNRIAKTTAIVACSTVLIASLGGCAQAPISETKAPDVMEYAADYSTQHVFTPVSFDQAIPLDDFEVTFDTSGWTEVYLPPSLNNNAVNYYFKGRFENNSNDVYRLNSSSEATITINGDYHLKGTVSVIDFGVVRDDSTVHPGETVDFIIRTPLPKSMRENFKSAVATFTLYRAGTENGTYTTHSSSVLGEYIIGVTKESDL